MKKQKKFGRKLALNKETIVRLDQRKLFGGRTEDCESVVVCIIPTLKLTKCALTECLVCPCEYPDTPPVTFIC
jgi:hypothetical protein